MKFLMQHVVFIKTVKIKFSVSCVKCVCYCCILLCYFAPTGLCVGSKDNSEAELHHITQPPPPPPPYQSLTGLGEKDSLPELPAGKLPEFAPEETKSKLAADKTSLTGTQSTESTSNLGHEMVDVNANEVPNQEDNNVNYSFDVLSSLGNAGQSLPPGANENKIQSWEDADDPGDVLSSVGDQSKNAASDTKTNAEGEPHPNIDVLSNLPAPSSYSAEPQSDKTEDRPDVLLDRLDVLQADSQPADLHPAYDQPETADNRKQDGGFKVSEYNPDSNSDNSRVGDEPSEPNVLHTVEIKLADVIPTHDAEKSASSNKPDEGNGMNTDSSSVSENTSSNQENDNLDSENDVETSFGNPPVLSNSDLRKIAKQIPTSLSPEEREKWQQNISNTLGLSAVDPGLAMLPRGQNSRTSPRTSTSTSSSTPFSWNSDADSTTAESSKPNSPVDKGQGMLNVIGNILKSNDNNHETGDEFQDDADVKNSLEDNFGRKVLTENEGEDEDEEDEDDRRYDSDYDYDNFFDEEEDYFGGGDVSKTSSSKSTNLENWKDEQAKNSKQSENRVDAVGKCRRETSLPGHCCMCGLCTFL